MSKSKGNTYRTYMYEQKVKLLPEHLNTDKKINTYLNDNLPCGTQWAWVIHDKDVIKITDDSSVGTPKDPHLHISIYLPNTKSVSAMASCMNDKEERIQIFKGENAKQNLFSYLVHKTEGSKADGKHVYSYDEIHSNFDYKSYVEGISLAIQSARINRDEIMQRVLTGELRMVDFIQQDDLMHFYLKNKTFVTNLIDAYYKRRMNEVAQQDKDGIEVIYVHGTEGSGKTSWAKKYALSRYRDICVSSSKNDAVQDYMGQDVMLFDDARPDQFSASDWLKLLDPYNNNCSVCSRYYNKYLNVKCIILTSTTPFEEFFLHADSSTDEPIGQFMRRFAFVVECEGKEEEDIIMTHARVYEVVHLDKVKSVHYHNRFINYNWGVENKPISENDVYITEKHKRLQIDASQFNI